MNPSQTILDILCKTPLVILLSGFTDGNYKFVYV